MATDSNYRRWPVSEFWQTVQETLERFGMVSGVARSEQVKPQMSRLLRAALGNLASAVALGSMAGVGDGHGWQVTVQWLGKQLDSEEFRETVETRRAKFATM